MTKGDLKKYSLKELLLELEWRRESSSGSEALARGIESPIKRSSTKEIIDAVKSIENFISR